MARTRRARKDAGIKPPSGNSWLSKRSEMQLDLLCIAFLYLLTLALFRGIVFDNALFAVEGDTATAEAYKRAGEHIRETEHVDPLWNPYLFSGMPSFGSLAFAPRDINYVQTAVAKVIKLFYLNATMSWMIMHYLLGGVFMFFLMRVWKMPRSAALFAAITFMLSPYAIGKAEEGHGSMIAALNYLPMVFLLTHLLFTRRDVLSLGLFAIGIGTLMLTYHVQIVYYVFLVIGLYLIYYVVKDLVTEKKFEGMTVALFVIGMLVGLAISSFVYISVYEYSHYSIRGGGTAGVPGGLDWDYATNWSFHPYEMINYLIPSFFGFSSRYLTLWQGQMTSLPLYWGTMPFTTSTVYIGVLPILFAVLALAYRRNRLTLFAAGLSVLFLLISFGKHFPLLFELLFNYLPFFNKFRAPSMILLLMPFSIGILAAHGMMALLEAFKGEGGFNTERLRKVLLYVLGGFWILLILGTLFRAGLYEAMAGSMFVKAGENYGPQVINELKKIRFEVLWSDYVKFVIILSVSVGVIVLALRKKMSVTMFSTAVMAILLIDIFIIDTKFVNPQPQRAAEEQAIPDATVQYLKQQPGLFRIFPVGEHFGDNSFVYHTVQTIGGYNPAKLRIYQTMLDSCLYKGPDPEFPINMNIVNMLNVRYLVAAGQLPANRFELVNADQRKRMYTHLNPGALPRAFFVGAAYVANNEASVFRYLNSAAFDPSKVAVVEKPLPSEIRTPERAGAQVVEYLSHKITVQATNSDQALLVLGEIYYPAGWNAYIDGVPTEIFKTNYILRSVVVPAGNHTIEFRFEPSSYELGMTLSHAGWGLAALLVLVGLWRIPRIRSKLFPGAKQAPTGNDGV